MASLWARNLRPRSRKLRRSDTDGVEVAWSPGLRQRALARASLTGFLGFTLFCVICAAQAFPESESPYAWIENPPAAQALCARIPCQPGYVRVAVDPASFGHWLRHLPLKPGCPDVRLFDGRPKSNQAAQHAVVDIDVGKRDLQQCADAVMRLRAEYLWHCQRDDAIHFHFLSGFDARYSRWREGWRPQVRGASVTEMRRAGEDRCYASFRRYLDTVFMYANTTSLIRDTVPVKNPLEIQIGDLFVCGNPRGVCHAVLVVDLAENHAGEREFLMVQSYMPAQDIHVLKNPLNGTPWYDVKATGKLITPEWVFERRQLRRFPDETVP